MERQGEREWKRERERKCERARTLLILIRSLRSTPCWAEAEGGGGGRGFAKSDNNSKSSELGVVFASGLFKQQLLEEDTA